ncbi:MAG: GTPase [Candidatus Woesearchaeota archaeon]
MPINAGFEYQRLEKEYAVTKTIQEKIIILQKMLQVGPKHKGAEKLRDDIKKKISKYKELVQKEKEQSKKRGKGISIKKEGAAQVVLIGVTNSGKSTLLSKITNAKPEIADYEFTTKKPEMGTMNYNGIIIQVIETPAITKNYINKEHGPAYLGIIRHADLIVIVSRTKQDEKLIKNELKEVSIQAKKITLDSQDENAKEKIWRNLNLIYVYTKMPGKEKDQPPISLQKNSTVKDLALKVHKDFIKNFDFARIWGKSAKFDAMRTGLTHKLQENDIVEFHQK